VTGSIVANDKARRWVMAVAMGLLAAVIYYASPILQVTDGRYSLLLSEAILGGHGFELDAWFQRPLDPAQHPSLEPHGLPYVVAEHRGHIHLRNPPGTALLSLPAVWLFHRIGWSCTGEDGQYRHAGEDAMQRVLAALVSGATVTIGAMIAMALVPIRVALLLSLALAFASPMWSIMSRSLWSQTWATLLMFVAVGLVVRSDGRGRHWSPWLLGTVLTWVYFTRASVSLQIVVISLWALALCWPRERWAMAGLKLALTGGAWLLLFVASSYAIFAQALPIYYTQHQEMFSLAHFWTSGSRLLVSPSRGLFLYWPWALPILYLGGRYGHLSGQRTTQIAAFLGIALQLLLLSFFPGMGGFAYGARFPADALVWWFLLACLGIGGWQASTTPEQRRPVRIVLFAALALGILIHARGALDFRTWYWNQFPASVTKHPERVWDWRYPQFLAGWIPIPIPESLPPLRLGEPLAAGTQDSLRYLWNGWTMWPGGTFQWSEGKDAQIIFALDADDAARATKLTLEFFPYLVAGKLDAQDIVATWNGTMLGNRLVNTPGIQLYEWNLPAGVAAERNEVRLSLPNATSPAELAESDDTRQIAIGLVRLWVD